MKTFTVFLLLAYARSEKLDLTYLPPPGSQYAGGRPEDIQVPLEFPKETYATTSRPQDFDSGITNPEDYQATISINRGLPTETLDASDVIPGSKAPFSYFQNTYQVPTTTVSYAFTQTTTHPPTESFETTIGPQFAGTGLPIQDTFNNFQPYEPGLTYQGNLDQPNYKQTQFGGQSSTGPLTQYPGYPTQSQEPVTIGENQQTPSRPGLQQNVGQFGGRRPIAPTTGPVSQFTTAQSQRPVATYEEDFQAQNRPDYKLVGNQLGVHPTFAPTSGPVTKFPVIPNQNLGNVGENIYGQQLNDLNQQHPGYQQSISGIRPGVPFGQTQYQNQSLNEAGFVNQPGFVPSTISPQGYFSTVRPGTVNGNRAGNIQGSLIPRPNAPQTITPNQIRDGQIINDEEAYQQQLGSQFNGEPNGNRNIAFKPSSTITPTSVTPGIQNGQFPTGTSVAPGSYSTSAYPGVQYNNQVGGASGIYPQRPERPQADADRNAVILNYENVITPEGFAYSFDTSNGIHADESGTATDGVKAKGSYSYIGDDGKLYSVVYTADENGYQPHGDHLPTPPPIPGAIQEIINKVNKEKEAGIYHDGSYDDDKYGHKKYYGAMSLRQQRPNKVFANGADIPGEYVTETTLGDMKPRRPLTGTRKPIVSTGDLSDFDLVNQQQSQYDNDEYDNNDQRTPGQISTQRPINRITVNRGEGKDGSILDGDNRSQNIKVPSKQPMRKVINKVKDSSSDTRLDSDKKRPGNKIGSQQIEDQASLEYGSEEPYYGDGDSNTRFSNKGPSKRPTNQQRPQNGQEDVTSIDTFEDDSNSNGPLTPGSFKRPINAPEEAFDEYETTRPTGKLPGRRPTNRPMIENDQDQYQPHQRYDIQKGSSPPSNQPFEYSDEDDSDRVIDDNENEEYVPRLPSRKRPDGKRPSSTSTSHEQSIRRRPGYIPKTSNGQNEDLDNQPGDDEKYIGSDGFENIPSRKYNNRRPVAGKPMKTLGGQYEETEYESNENKPVDGSYNRPQSTSSAKFDKTRPRPQTSGPRGKPQTSLQDNRSQILKDDEKYNIPGAKFGQKLNKPSIYQQSGQVENVNYKQQPANETGYQYIPPRTKFEQEQDQEKRFPVNYIGSTRRPSQQNVFYQQEDMKSEPFITPNVARDEGDFTDDVYDQEEGSLEIIPGKNQKQKNRLNTEYSQYPDSGSTPDQIFGDGIISSTASPGKYTSSTYGPSPTRGRPMRPQYNQNTPNVPGFENSVTQKGNNRPNQGTDRFNENKYTNLPYGGVSSTTPMPSVGPYGSTYGSTTPEQQNNFVTGNTYQTPEQRIISSTTPLPSQGPNFKGNYQTYTNQPQYQSTIRPAGSLRPATENTDGTTGQRFPTMSSRYSTSNVGPYKNTQYGNDLPSTTYRPNYTIPNANGPVTTAVPGITVDGFGRPIRPGYSSTVRDYYPGSTPSGQPIRDQGTKIRYQPGESPSEQFGGQKRYQPGSKPAQQESQFQSSTQKIIGEDFSGPKQQQKFDPKTGYYY